MRDEFVNKLAMYKGVKDVLREPDNESLWLDNPPYLTELVTDFEQKAQELGAFGNQQSQTLAGITQQQNLAETSLEDAAHPLSRALRLKLRVVDENLAEAAAWDLQLTDWREMHETSLLDKVTALHELLLPLTTGATPLGVRFGITGAKVTALGDLIDDYADVIGAPRAARGARKAKTSALRPRFRVVDSMLGDMDDIMIGLRGESDAIDLFVDTYFNARRIGGRTESDNTTNSTTPTP